MSGRPDSTPSSIVVESDVEGSIEDSEPIRIPGSPLKVLCSGRYR